MPGSLLKFVKTLSVKIGGRRYPVTKIGNQLWMAENLDYKFDVNGNQIPIGGSSAPTTPAAWYYNNNETDYGIDGTYKCGLLYNWYAAKYLDDNKTTLLPNGWHVPTASEVNTLITASEVSGTYGDKLKALDNSVVQGFPSDFSGTDDYGFSVLPSGYSDLRYSGKFYALGNTGYIMCVDAYGPTVSERLQITKNQNIYLGTDNKVMGFSLRLVKSLT